MACALFVQAKINTTTTLQIKFIASTPLSTGFYSVIATDENGCKAIETIFLETSPVPELLLLDIREIECSDPNGSILVLVNDSTANVTYSWAHDASNDSPLAENLEMGNYSITVSNANGCSTSANYGVPGTTAPEIQIADLQPVNCNQALGQVEVSINNGTPPFEFQWSHNDSLNTALAENLVGGMLQLYSVAVVDSNECQDSIRFNLPVYNRPQAALDSLAGSLCDNPSGAALLKPIPYALFRINCGLETDTLVLDQYGNNYEQDSLYFTGGVPEFFNLAVANTSTEILFQNRRTSEENFNYQFPLIDGDYEVRLGFAEIQEHQLNIQNENRFTVLIEGNNVLDNFSVFENFGTNNAGWQTFETTVIDGSLDIEFIAQQGYAQVSTIEIIPLPQAPLTYSWLHDNANTSAQAFNLEPGNYEVALTDQMLLVTDSRIFNLINNYGDLATFSDFLVKEAQVRLPELKQFDYSIAAQQRLQRSRERAFYLPSVAVSGSIDQTLERFNMVGDFPPAPNKAQWSVGIGLQYPIAQGGRRRINVEQTKLNILQLRDQRANVQNQLEFRLRAAIETAGASFSRVQLSKEAADAGKANFKIVQDAYSQGLVQITALIDAQNAALQTEISAVNAIYQFVTDFLAVERAAGFYYFLATKTEQDAFFERLIAFIAAKERMK